jgi:hypothetical protein
MCARFSGRWNTYSYDNPTKDSELLYETAMNQRKAGYKFAA